MKTLEQRRANHAWKCLAEHYNEEYRRMSKGAPAMIMGNGLMPALAYYQAKSCAGKALVSDILDWLATDGPLKGKIERKGGDSGNEVLFRKAMEAFHDGSSSMEYMRATEEALEILRWIRQFADALKPSAGEQGE